MTKRRTTRYLFWGKGDTLKRYLHRNYNDTRAMMPYVRKFGLRYLYDQKFRNSKRRHIANRKQKDKYGAGFLSNRKLIRKRLVKRDGPGCKKCRRAVPYITIDHILPRSQGGTNALSNLQLLCPPCHKEKTMVDNGRGPILAAINDAHG